LSEETHLKLIDFFLGLFLVLAGVVIVILSGAIAQIAMEGK